MNPIYSTINVQSASPNYFCHGYFYSKTDTVRNLKQKIYDYDDVPIEQQYLEVRYGWKKFWQRVQLIDDKALLIDHLQGAKCVKLWRLTARN